MIVFEDAGPTAAFVFAAAFIVFPALMFTVFYLGRWTTRLVIVVARWATRLLVTRLHRGRHRAHNDPS